MEELLVEALGNEVGGVARPEGLPVTFIRGALPGEIVKCEPSGGGRTWREARLLEILTLSPERIEPFCPAFGSCGGCSMQHLRYEGQLHWKREWISSAFSRAHLASPAVEPVAGAPDRAGYRNRVTFQVRDERLHLHRHRGDPLPVSDCPLLHPEGRRAASLLDRHAGSGPGGVSIRASFTDGRTSLEFDGFLPPLPLPEGLGKAEVWHHEEGGWKRCDSSGTRSLLKESMAGIPMTVPPGGFFQVNTRAASAMVESVLRDVCGHGKGDVLDLYGGAGTFSIPLASRGFGTACVDSSSEALEAGRTTAEELGLGGEGFVQHHLDAGRFLVEMQGVRGRFDTIISDPPRSGMGKEVAGLLPALEARRLVMVSCNPFTLARDLECLLGSYDITRIAPFDLFPQTDHVETVCFLERKPGKRG